MSGSRFLFLAVVLGAIDILVPYLWLGERPRFAASYLFWCSITFAVIVGAGLYTRQWGRRR